MNYAIITENDISEWDDKTGVSYHYPNKYVNVLTPGTKVIYYKGKIQEDRFSNERMSDEPHYFGVGIIGDKEEDFIEKDGKTIRRWHCEIQAFQPFDNAIPAKVDGEYLETIPESKKKNYWWDGVRVIDKETYDKILDLAGLDFEEEYDGFQQRVPASKFDEVYEHFKEYIKYLSDEEFTGFHEGYMHMGESYKAEIREEALGILDIRNWNESIIGTGEIVSRVIETMELEENNLVGTRNQYGHKSLPHYRFLDARDDGTNLEEIEQTLFDFYKRNNDPEDTFNKMTTLIGRRFAPMAFLYYLKNDREYLPISSKNFEIAFEEIESGVRLTNCTWEQYQTYLETIREVQGLLEAKMNMALNFIDAHSFLWVIGYKGKFREWLDSRDELEEEIRILASIVSPVNNSQSQNRANPNVSDSESNPDFITQARKKQIKGRKAEEIVMKFERDRLTEAGKPELAEKVKDFSKRFSYGFDIRSYNEDGTNRDIEVKASSSNGFILTRNELYKSTTNPNYWIYIVNIKKHEVQIKQIPSPELKNPEKFKLEPKDYYVSFSIES